jgi:hypothetical protein
MPFRVLQYNGSTYASHSVLLSTQPRRQLYLWWLIVFVFLHIILHILNSFDLPFSHSNADSHLSSQHPLGWGGGGGLSMEYPRLQRSGFRSRRPCHRLLLTFYTTPTAQRRTSRASTYNTTPNPCSSALAVGSLIHKSKSAPQRLFPYYSRVCPVAFSSTKLTFSLFRVSLLTHFRINSK